MAKDTIGLTDTLGIQRAHIFGISMGGLIAQEIALSYPERVHQLVLGCTGYGPLWWPQFSMNSANHLLHFLTRPTFNFRSFFTNLFFSQTTLKRQPERIKRFSQSIRKTPTAHETQLKQIAAMLCFDSYSRLRHIRAQSMIITGTEDCMVPPHNSDILTNHIPHTRLVKLEECGHNFFIESPKAVFEELVGFLKNEPLN